MAYSPVEYGVSTFHCQYIVFHSKSQYGVFSQLNTTYRLSDYISSRLEIFRLYSGLWSSFLYLLPSEQILYDILTLVLGCANFEDSIKDVVTETMTEPTLREYMEEVQADYGSYTTTPRFNKNVKFELGDKFLKILCDNAFNETNGDDVVDHTEKVLKILELIKILDVNPNKLRVHVFSLSLTGAAQNWWIDENGWKNQERTMGILDGGDDEVLMDDIVASDDEREESGNKNHPNDNANSIFKPYLDAQKENNICTIMKGHDEHRLETRDCNVDKSDDISVRNNALHLFNEDDEALNKGVCKSKKFKVIRYLLGHSEEYVAISTCKYDVWKRTEGIVSCVYHDFCKNESRVAHENTPNDE
ncbi:hypothetical protein Tco_0793301 [Tanacetum coccineum]